MDGGAMGKRQRIQDARGMTLVELMVGLLVFSMVMGAVFSLFSTSLTAYWKGDLATQVQQGGRISLERIARDLRQARRLINATTGGSFTFNTACNPYQISFVLPHLGPVTLSDGTTIYATDAIASGQIPYDGWYVSYYLSAVQGGTTPNAVGPYLERTAYNVVVPSLSTVSIASNVTSLAFASGSSCPATSAREVTVTVTASQTATGQNVSSTDIVKSDVALRNSGGPP